MDERMMPPVDDDASYSPSILIVDDSSVNRKVMSFILQSAYDRLHTVDDGQQCLDALNQTPFDLVLLDLNMPAKNGFEVLQTVRATATPKSDSGRHTPAFIVVSADNNPDTISRALQLGAADYVTTPFNRDELLARVKTHLALRSREQDLEARVQQRTSELEATNQALQKAQNQLIQAEKMVSLGQLSAGIAHEINNPIGYILSNLDSLQDYMQDVVKLIGQYQQAEPYISDASARKQLQNLQDSINVPFLKEDVQQLITDSLSGARQVKQIIADLKVFAHHPQNRQWEKVSLESCIRSVLNMIKNEIKYKAEIHLDLEAALPSIDGVTTQIYQVMTNLLVNAAQAIPVDRHGDVFIQTRNLQPAEDAIEISIRDTGTGMDDDVLSKIFDPFFTTKEVGQGTGLGLSVSYGFIEAHHGRIEVHSEPGRGSHFVVTLPISQH
ncbi:response regulator [Aestuariicella hydrocarbonica]|uniref:histidine kinase n=1 Tax=Pseudomaricurvus hydrocarbonicus TaxID=1470433 RepID=A0A9E5MGL8_9GAMM|nr:ATP-binding protein [Aestuariicella hydrocarbonica]NHO64851.1 response regulator [Aestuariicella hydrocarbonica]